MSAPFRLARAVVRASAWLVPSGRRDEWRAEWDGELAASWRRAPGARIVLFALGAIPHAFAELRQDWSVAVLWHEVRYAVRTHLRNPVYSLTAAVLIALGVGANTTVFTLVNAVLLRAPRGVEAPDRVVQVGRVGATTSDPRDFDSWSYPLYRDFREKSASFTDLAAYVTIDDAVIGRDADAERATVQLVSANYFRLLGASPVRGRAFVEDDEAPGATSVTVISDALWHNRLGSDPDIVGKTISIRGTPFRIIGVAAPVFNGADVGAPRPQLWVPLTASDGVSPRSMGRLDSRLTSWLWIIGRLKSGVAPDAARADLASVFRSIQLDLGGKVREGVAVVTGLGLRPEDRAIASTISAALSAMVAVVLLVACANLAALLLARGVARESEIGVRLAIGAGRGRVVRQLLIETTLIAIAGSVAAFVFTRWTARFVEWVLPYELSVSLQPDLHVLAFAIVIGVATSAIFGVAPALRATRVDVASLLRAGAVGIVADRGRLRTTLLVSQIALSFILLGATGVMMRSVQRAGTADPGFVTDRVFVGELDVRGTDNAAPGALTARLESVAARAAATPGVVGVTLASSVPASGSMSSRGTRRSDAPADTRPTTVSTLVIDTAYFHTMGVPILRGRAFDAALDRPGTTSGVVINEALARRFWPGEEAIGKAISFGSLTGQVSVPVIGIARDTRNRSLRAPPAPQLYLLLSQNPVGQSLLHVRVAPGQESILAALSADLRAATPGSPAVRFQPMREWLARGYADVRLISILGGVFGVLALALAAAGIHGVVSYETTRRRREYGLRLALGARTMQVHGMVLARSARLSAYGITIGAAGFAAVAPLLKRWLFGVPALDPVALGTITVVLLAAATVAALAPAARAARSDPIDSLRAG